MNTSYLTLTGASTADYALPSQGPTLTATITGVAPTVVVVISAPASQSYDGSAKPISGIAKFYGTGWLLLNGARDSKRRRAGQRGTVLCKSHQHAGQRTGNVPEHCEHRGSAHFGK